MVVIEGMGTHLRMHNDQLWHHLNSMTLAIFQAEENAINKKMEDYAKMLEEQA